MYPRVLQPQCGCFLTALRAAPRRQRSGTAVSAATGLASCLPDESSAGSLPLVSVSLFTPLTAAEMAPYMKRLSRGQTVEGEAGAGPRASLQGTRKSRLAGLGGAGLLPPGGAEGAGGRAAGCRQRRLGRPCSGGAEVPAKGSWRLAASAGEETSGPGPQAAGTRGWSWEAWERRVPGAELPPGRGGGRLRSLAQMQIPGPQGWRGSGRVCTPESSPLAGAVVGHWPVERGGAFPWALPSAEDSAEGSRRRGLQ